MSIEFTIRKDVNKFGLLHVGYTLNKLTSVFYVSILRFMINCRPLAVNSCEIKPSDFVYFSKMLKIHKNERNKTKLINESPT